MVIFAMSGGKSCEMIDPIVHSAKPPSVKAVVNIIERVIIMPTSYITRGKGVNTFCYTKPADECSQDMSMVFFPLLSVECSLKIFEF